MYESPSATYRRTDGVGRSPLTAQPATNSPMARTQAPHASAPHPHGRQPAQHERRFPPRLLDQLEPGHPAQDRRERSSGAPAARAARPGSSGSLRRTRRAGCEVAAEIERVRAGRTRRDRGSPSRTAMPPPGRVGWPCRRSRCPRGPSARTSAAGVSKRSSSSTRPSRRGPGRRAGGRAPSGWRNSVHQPLPAPFTDASWPALRSSTQVPMISSLGQRSPSSTTATRALIRSSRGRTRRSAMRSRR